MAEDHEPRPVPKLLVWGLVGGFVLFLIILAYITLNREKLTPEAPPAQPSESRSASPPQ